MKLNIGLFAVAVLAILAILAVGFYGQQQVNDLKHQLDAMKIANATLGSAVDTQTEKDQLLRVILSETKDTPKLTVDQVIALRDVIWEQTQFYNEYGLTSSRILAMIRQESNFDPLAQSNAGAFGLTQVMPYTASEHMTPTQQRALAQNPDILYDVTLNVTLGVKELMKLHAAFVAEGLEELTDFRLSHTAYFWGYTGTKRLLAASGVEAPKPSLHYANSVMQYEQQYRQEVMN